MFYVLSLVLSFLSVGACWAPSVPPPQVHHVRVGTFHKKYPLKPIQGTNLSYVYLYDMADNLDLMRASVDVLGAALEQAAWWHEIDGVVVPGDKANVWAAFLVRYLQQKHPHVFFYVMRGTDKGGCAAAVTYQPITSTTAKTLYVREDQALGLAHKKVLLVDDVLSTGETLKAAKKLITQVGGTVRAVAVFATEGEKRGALFEGCPLSYVCHLPLYRSM